MRCMSGCSRQQMHADMSGRSALSAAGHSRVAAGSGHGTPGREPPGGRLQGVLGGPRGAAPLQGHSLLFVTQQFYQPLSQLTRSRHGARVLAGCACLLLNLAPAYRESPHDGKAVLFLCWQSSPHLLSSVLHVTKLQFSRSDIAESIAGSIAHVDGIMMWILSCCTACAGITAHARSGMRAYA